MKFSLGLFDEEKKRLPREVIGSAEHIEVNRKLTRESMVLLENNGVLPLKEQPRRIAVIGPNADDIRAQYGDWTFFSHPGAAPDDCVPLGDYYTVLRGIRTVFPESEVVYAKGCDLMEYTSDAMMQKAVGLAESADIVICVIGDCLKQNGEARDRANLELSGRQNELVRRLKDTGKQIVTVLVNGKPLCIGEAVKNSSAVIEMFNGGDLGGLCVAELIAGKWNPSGKLPISFPRASAQIPCYYNTYPGWHGEKYMDVAAGNLYDFGYGLSYTTYAYSDIMLSSATAKAGDVLTVSVDVTNTGDMDGYIVCHIHSFGGLEQLFFALVKSEELLVGNVISRRTASNHTLISEAVALKNNCYEEEVITELTTEKLSIRRGTNAGNKNVLKSHLFDLFDHHLGEEVLAVGAHILLRYILEVLSRMYETFLIRKLSGTITKRNYGYIKLFCYNVEEIIFSGRIFANCGDYHWYSPCRLIN